MKPSERISSFKNMLLREWSLLILPRSYSGQLLPCQARDWLWGEWGETPLHLHHGSNKKFAETEPTILDWEKGCHCYTVKLTKILGGTGGSSLAPRGHFWNLQLGPESRNPVQKHTCSILLLDLSPCLKSQVSERASPRPAPGWQKWPSLGLSSALPKVSTFPSSSVSAHTILLLSPCPWLSSLRQRGCATDIPGAFAYPGWWWWADLL